MATIATVPTEGGVQARPVNHRGEDRADRCPTCGGDEYIRTAAGKVRCPTCRGSGLARPPVRP